MRGEILDLRSEIETTEDMEFFTEDMESIMFYKFVFLRAFFVFSVV